MMATCPTDSLDCLLRAILTAQSGYNWNPLTFGATVAIGVLALAVTMTTVFQGALSAGPGRLKASQRAIGPVYYEKSRTEFSWIELRFRTTAWVPYIDSVRWFGRQGLALNKQRYGFKEHTSYGAGWLNLIDSIPRECHHWAMTRCQTDYLPSDIQAAPARATIQAVVELSVLTVCDSVTLINGFPLATGHGSQLSFRDHPYLGIVAVFDQYVIDDHKSHPDVRKCHTLYLAGQFSFQDFFMEALLFDGKTSSKFSLSSISAIEALRKLVSPQGELAPYELHSVEMGLSPGTLKSVALGLMIWDSPDNCNGLPYSKLRLRSALMQLCQTDGSWNSCNGDSVLGSLYALLQHRSNIMAYDKHGASRSEFDGELRRPNLGWTWLASGYLGYSNSSGPGDLQHLAALAQNSGCRFGRRHGQRVFQGKLCWFDWRPSGPSDVPMAVSADDGNLVVLPSVFRRCLTWLSKEDLFDDLSSDEKLDARSAIGHQIHEVDYWLLHQGSIESAAQVFGILMDFVEVSPPAVMEPLHNDMGSHIPPGEVRSASPNILRSRPSFERRRPPSMPSTARACAHTRERESPINSSRSGFISSDSFSDLHDARPRTEVRRADVRRMSRKRMSPRMPTGISRKKHEQGNREQAGSFPRRSGPKVSSLERRWYYERVECVIYLKDQPAPRKDTAELLERCGKLLDVLEELPNIRALDQMVPRKGYLCTLDQCDKAFNNAYNLRDHCLVEHDYSEVDWAADSLSLLNYDENLASAFEWNTDPEYQLVGSMTRRKEAEGIAHEIARNLEMVGQGDLYFHEFLEEAQWSWMTELEQQKRNILDAYLLPSPLPSRSSIHSNYITRIFEVKKYRLFWAFRRQWPIIQVRVDEILREAPGQRQDGSTAPSEGTYLRPPQNVALPQPRWDLVRYHGIIGGDDQTTLANSASNNNNAGALLTYRDVSEKETIQERQNDVVLEKRLVIRPGAKERRRRRRQRSSERYTGDSESARDQYLAIRRNKRGRQRSQRLSQHSDHGTADMLAPSRLMLPAREDRPSSPSSQIIRGKVSAADKGMRTLLIYRAVLFAALCALAADTSSVHDTELGRRVVQVL